MYIKAHQRVEGIRRTATGWVVVLTERGESIVPGRSPRRVVAGPEFTGAGSKARAIRAAGTNRVIEGAARELVTT